uniref:Putative trypsin-like serine protease n=1 Tax=Corethrella appendiculata TaxID=1370023 RepID=U5ERT1_9DIPT
MLFFGFLFVIFISDLAAQTQHGDQCTTSDNRNGVCQPLSTCAKPEDINVSANLCSNEQEPIVCCPESRVSYKKCKLFGRLAYKTYGVTSLSLNPTVVNVTIPECDHSVPLIVGGEKAKIGEFPHMAALGYKNSDNGKIEFRCGGTLISEHFILTAGHCLITQTPVVVRLNEYNMINDSDDAVDYDIEAIIKHPSYKPTKSKYNDIALLKLTTPVSLSKEVRPACLHNTFNIKTNRAVAIGFGKVEFAGDQSNELLKVGLDIFPNDECQMYYNDRKLKSGIIDTQICSGYKEGGKDTCEGDSGGPLQITDPNNQCLYYVIGVTSLGKSCGGATPAIYTRVSSYLDWIESVVWPPVQGGGLLLP